jgi:hypothetical protein
MSQLRGQLAVNIRKRVKALFYGDAGTGKSTCAINFPKPYYIDTERGSEHSQYIDTLRDNGGVVFQTRDFADLYKEVRVLASEKHAFETIVIDPITPIYNNLVDAYGRKERVGTAHGRHYGAANRDFERLIDLLLRVDMNVVITAHGKKEYSNDMSLVGSTYDGYKKLSHIFDLIIEAKNVGKNYVGIVKKSRISTIPTNEEIVFNYKAIHDLYGKDILGGESVPLISTPAEPGSYKEKLLEIITPNDLATVLTYYKLKSVNSLDEATSRKVYLRLIEKIGAEENV